MFAMLTNEAPNEQSQIIKLFFVQLDVFFLHYNEVN